MKGKAHAYAWVFPFIEWKLRESNGPLRKTSGGRFLGPGVIASEPRQKAATVRSDSLMYVLGYCQVGAIGGEPIGMYVHRPYICRAIGEAFCAMQNCPIYQNLQNFMI